MQKPYKFTILYILLLITILFLYCMIITAFGITLSLKIIALGFILTILATISISTHIFIKIFVKE